MWLAGHEWDYRGLLDCLPEQGELMEYLDAFQKRAQACSFPHVPSEITKTEVERFLSDKRKNAEAFPDMLALLFAALALGAQHGVWDRHGGKWAPGAMEQEVNKANVYSESIPFVLILARCVARLVC